MKTKIALGCVVAIGLGMLGACDGGTAEDTGGSGGTDSSGGASPGAGGAKPGTGGTTPGTGGALGGDGGGGGEPAEPTEVEAFCDKYETDCGFEDADFYTSIEDCLSGAEGVKDANPDRWSCMQTHLDNVTLYEDTVHCTHASGEVSPCASSDFPL